MSEGYEAPSLRGIIDGLSSDDTPAIGTIARIVIDG